MPAAVWKVKVRLVGWSTTLLVRVMLTDWSAPKLTWGIVRRLVWTESMGSPALVVIAI